MNNNIMINMILPTAAACLLNAVANSFWKWQLIRTPLNLKELNSNLPLLYSPWIWAGSFTYIISISIFMYLFSNFRLSIVIPLSAMTYIFNIIAAYIFFGERLSPVQLIGVAVIIIGVVLVSREGSSIIK